MINNSLLSALSAQPTSVSSVQNAQVNQENEKSQNWKLECASLQILKGIPSADLPSPDRCCLTQTDIRKAVMEHVTSTPKRYYSVILIQDSEKRSMIADAKAAIDWLKNSNQSPADPKSTIQDLRFLTVAQPGTFTCINGPCDYATFSKAPLQLVREFTQANLVQYTETPGEMLHDAQHARMEMLSDLTPAEDDLFFHYMALYMHDALDNTKALKKIHEFLYRGGKENPEELKRTLDRAEKIAELWPDNWKVQKLLGDLFSSDSPHVSTDPLRMISHYRQAAEAMDQNAPDRDLLLQFALLLKENNLFSEAEEYFKMVLRFCEPTFQRWNEASRHLGNLYFEEKNYKAAIPHLSNIWELDALSFERLLVCCHQMKMFKKALKVTHEAAEKALYPEIVTSSIFLIHCAKQEWAQAKKYAEGVPEALRKTFESNPLVIKSLTILSYNLRQSELHISAVQDEKKATQ